MKPGPITAKLFVLLILLSIISCEPQQVPLKISNGQTVASLPVTDVNGKSTVLNLISGKVTILNIWATWCGPCRHEMPSLDRLSGMLDKERFQVIGLSVDTDDHVVREFLIERKVGFNNFMDPGMDATNNIFGVRVFPSTFVFSEKGQLLDVIEGWKDWDTPVMVSRLNRLGAS